MMQRTRTIAQRLLRVAGDLGVEVNTTLSQVCLLGDTYSVSVTTAQTVATEFQRSMMQSALHASLQEEFEDDKVDIRVTVPCAQTEPLTSVTPLPTEWFSEWPNQQRHQEFAMVFAQLAYRHVVYALPWRERRAMLARIPQLVQRSMEHVSCGFVDPVAEGDLDAVLPPMESMVLPLDIPVIQSEVALHLCRAPKSLLELYETVYRLGRSLMRMTPQTANLYVRLFA